MYSQALLRRTQGVQDGVGIRPLVVSGHTVRCLEAHR